MKLTKRYLKSKAKLINKILFGFILIELVLATIIICIFDPVVKQTLASLTSVKEESFTELYFADHTQLPKIVHPGETYSFAFIIHNLTNSDMQYIPDVYFDVNGQKFFLDRKTIFVKKNEYRTVNETFTLSANFPRVKIVAELPNTQQQIAFWAEISK